MNGLSRKRSSPRELCNCPYTAAGTVRRRELTPTLKFRGHKEMSWLARW